MDLQALIAGQWQFRKPKEQSREEYTEDTIPVLDELQSIAQQAIDRFSRFSNLQIRVANNQPPIPPDIIEIVDRSIQTTEQKIPALKRSIQEITQEWRLS